MGTAIACTRRCQRGRVSRNSTRFCRSTKSRSLFRIFSTSSESLRDGSQREAAASGACCSRGHIVTRFMHRLWALYNGSFGQHHVSAFVM